jgi:hypothetical protein
MIEVLVDSPALLSYERTLHERAVLDLADALAEAWGCRDEDSPAACHPVLAEVTASIWMAAARTVLTDKRSDPPRLGDDAAVRGTVELIDDVLAELDTGLTLEERTAGPTCRVG